jgi:3'-phosphoadenosine 5'-phosphosulfate sulfotransferase (PAPS reductase)/FAD synthetase
MNIRDVIESAPTGPILDMFAKIYSTLGQHERVVVYVSGGADSDVVVDAFHRLDKDKKVRYAYCATGMEYEATKRHLKELEKKYDIVIEEVKPSMPIPTCCRKYGVPFWSKMASEMIYRLQRHNFKWEDEPFDVLYERYPKCKSALMWWCNMHPPRKDGSKSSLNIEYTLFLKEYMMENPPPVPISAKCCIKTKREPADRFEREQEADMVCTGVRKSEGGLRSLKHKTCFTAKAGNGADTFRPLFWLTDSDRGDYEVYYGVKHSDCYVVWGMKRTGCPGCPYGKDFESELELMQKYEPKFHRAALKIFGASYEYTRGYLRFREERKKKKAEEVNL